MTTRLFSAAGIWLGLFLSCHGSCIEAAIQRVLSDRTCGEVTAREADQASMIVTDCVLRGLRQTPNCLKSGTERCVTSLSPEVYSCYRRVRTKWDLLCGASQQVSIIVRLRRTIEDSEGMRNQLERAAKQVQSGVVESVERGLRIGESFDRIGGEVSGAIRRIEETRDLFEGEIGEVRNALENKVEQVCAKARSLKERKIRNAGMLASGYTCLAAIVVGAGNRWNILGGGVLFVVAMLFEFFRVRVWAMRLSLLLYCGWLVASMRCIHLTNPTRAVSCRSSRSSTGHFSDDGRHTDGCDCCFDDNFNAY